MGRLIHLMFSSKVGFFRRNSAQRVLAQSKAYRVLLVSKQYSFCFQFIMKVHCCSSRIHTVVAWCRWMGDCL